MRTVLFALVAVATVAGAGCGSGSHKHALSACRGSDVAVKTLGTNGAAGTLYAIYAVANNGPKCTLGGYPPARFKGLTGNPRPQVVHDHRLPSGERPRRLTLATGRRAGFYVATSDVPAGNQRPWKAKSVEIEIGGHWFSLGDASSTTALYESPFLQKVPGYAPG